MVELELAFFNIEGDNVYFKGLDSTKSYGGYSCPLFESFIAETAAGYIATPNRYFAVIDDDLYLITDKEKKAVDIYDINGKLYWDFTGWEWIKTPIK